MKDNAADIAASMGALATGFAFSGPILIVGKMLQPSLPFVAPQLYFTVLYLGFAISALTWAALYLPGMTSLFKKSNENPLEKLVTSSLEDVMNRAVLKLTLANGNITRVQDIILKAAKARLLSDISALESTIPQEERFEKEGNWLHRKNPINYTYWAIEAKKARLTQLKELIAIIEDKITDKSDLKTSDANEYAGYCNYFKKTLEFGLIQEYPQSMLDHIRKNFHLMSMNFMTLFNAAAINSVGLVAYGAFPLINLLSIRAAALKYVIILFFFGVGAVGALSLSRPGANAAVRAMFGYSKEELEAANVPAEKKENAGYFKLSTIYQKWLAAFMSIGIAVGNYSAAVAFGKALGRQFSGGNFLSMATLTPRVLSNPFLAGKFTIAFGMISGIFTFCVVVALLISTTLAVKPKTKEKRLSITRSESFRLFISSLTVLTSIISTHAFYAGGLKAIIPTVSLYATPIALLALAVTFTYANYLQCYDSKATFMSNIMISTTVMLGALVSGYLNSLPGSLFAMALGSHLSKITAALLVISNLEMNRLLILPAKDKLDEYSPSLEFKGFEESVIKAISPTPGAAPKQDSDEPSFGRRVLNSFSRLLLPGV